jgi:ethanolamine transporter EutH
MLNDCLHRTAATCLADDIGGFQLANGLAVLLYSTSEVGLVIEVVGEPAVDLCHSLWVILLVLQQAVTHHTTTVSTLRYHNNRSNYHFMTSH